MQIALYRGRSLVSRSIRFITRSPYSHAAFLFDEAASEAAYDLYRRRLLHHRLTYFEAGSVVEAWSGGVKNSPSLSSLHTPGTRVEVFQVTLSLEQEQALVNALGAEIGAPYSYWNVLKFLSKREGRLDGSWFCSELVFAMLQDAKMPLLANTKAWEVPPDWIARSPVVSRVREALTGKAGAFVLAALLSLTCAGCRSNSSGWPIIWPFNNGTPTPTDKQRRSETQHNFAVGKTAIDGVVRADVRDDHRVVVSDRSNSPDRH